MARLSPGTLRDVPPAVRRPGYDRARLNVGMAHIGVGAFHRCHQAEFTDDALEAEFGPWGSIGINIRDPLLRPTLGAQQGLYSRTLSDEDQVETRIIGCMREAIDAQNDSELAIAALAAPRIKLVTMTVTEKGYCHFPSTGALNPDHQDIVHDLGRHAKPRSVPGIVVEALRRRRDTHAGPITLMSCDNIPSNGRILHSVVTTLAAQKYPDLNAWIADNVRFPSAMVDRIVPATSEADIAYAAETCEVEDSVPVVGEPFRQWVIEDDFAAARPRWDLAGVEFVTDVEPYEFIKMRVLNGAQTAMSYFGALAGIGHTFEDVRDPIIARFVRHMLEHETAPNLPKGAMDVPSYIDLTFKRLLNSSVRHRNHQIATDGSQKIVQRLLNPIRFCIARGMSYDFLAAATAAWMAYLLAASPKFGARWEPSDPWAETIRKIGDEIGLNSVMLAGRIMGIEAIFGTDLLSDAALTQSIARHLNGLLLGDSQQHLNAMLSTAAA
ncbi:MAG TPA: mannitol dehydrogenase family protein [Magnetospirillaceae bacterium]|jgi:fructuronate reductase